AGVLGRVPRRAGELRILGAQPRPSARPLPLPTRRGKLDGGAARAVALRTLCRVILAHLDLDAFFAAVEELENPELKRVPLVVGGDPHGRGVVATANYVARRYGIHSAMSCAEALRRCPHAVFVRGRHTLYREYSRAVWQAVREV